MTEGGSRGGFGRIFGRRRKEGDSGEQDRAEGAEGQGGALGVEDDSEARGRREAEADAIQLARERAIAEEAERREQERLKAERDARDTVLSELTLWTDTHCHIQYAADDAEASDYVQRAAEVGTRRMICVGTDVESSLKAIEIAATQSRTGALTIDVYATVGLHPHDAKNGVDPIRGLLSDLRDGNGDGSRVVAVGECGLDYHYDHSPRASQRRAFSAQVALANEHDLALVIHTREAFDDTLEILEAEGVPERTVFHCFTGGPDDAERCLAIGAYLSFSGIVTFNNASDVRAAVKICPPERLLIETDSPYLTPVPHRGKPNEPSFVPLVGEAVGREKDLSREEVAAITSDNAVSVFRLSPR